MAAGHGSRMGSELPKQFLPLAGRAVLHTTISKFTEAVPGISVVTVLPQGGEYVEWWKRYCVENNFNCPQLIVNGGITRFHSVRNALERIPEGALVAVHDGVRPLLSVDLVRRMFSEAEDVEALVPVTPCVDTMKVLRKVNGKDGRQTLEAVPGAKADRECLFGAQTPEIFHSELLKAAYAQAYDTTFTDDGSVVEKYGKNLSYTMGERLNIKITTPDDLVLARAIEQCKR